MARTRGRVQGLHLVLSGLFSKYLNVGVVEVVLVILKITMNRPRSYKFTCPVSVKLSSLFLLGNSQQSTECQCVLCQHYVTRKDEKEMQQMMDKAAFP